MASANMTAIASEAAGSALGLRVRSGLRVGDTVTAPPAETLAPLPSRLRVPGDLGGRVSARRPRSASIEIEITNVYASESAV